MCALCAATRFKFCGEMSICPCGGEIVFDQGEYFHSLNIKLFLCSCVELAFVFLGPLEMGGSSQFCSAYLVVGSLDRLCREASVGASTCQT